MPSRHASTLGTSPGGSRPEAGPSMTPTSPRAGVRARRSAVSLAPAALWRLAHQPAEVEVAPALVLAEPDRHPLEVAPEPPLERVGGVPADVPGPPRPAAAAARLHLDRAVLGVEALHPAHRLRAAHGTGPEAHCPTLPGPAPGGQPADRCAIDGHSPLRGSWPHAGIRSAEHGRL